VSHPTARLDNTVHQRVRLGILTVLSEADRADFSYLRDALELTDGNLSRNLQVLEDAGYVAIEKTFEGKRPRTWVTATREGQQALASELAALRELIGAEEPKRTAAPARLTEALGGAGGTTP
jgi:DNA-binding MarR family transcriptional regulator